MAGKKGAAGRIGRAGVGTLLAGVALRRGSAIARRAVERRLTGEEGQGKARRILTGGRFGKSVAAVALVRLATRSVPGALAVGGGLIAKALYDRRRNRTPPE